MSIDGRGVLNRLINDPITTLPNSQIQRSSMLITKMAIPRRTFLRGAGAALALPLLDGMVPALSAISQTAAKTNLRLAVVYVPNGMIMESWTPKVEGSAFELTPTLGPLAPFRDRFTVLSGLAANGGRALD